MLGQQAAWVTGRAAWVAGAKNLHRMGPPRVQSGRVCQRKSEILQDAPRRTQHSNLHPETSIGAWVRNGQEGPRLVASKPQGVHRRLQ